LGRALVENGMLQPSIGEGAIAMHRTNPASRRADVRSYVRQHFAAKGDQLLRDGALVDPSYPANKKRPRAIRIGVFKGTPVVLTVAQVRLLLHLGDLPSDARVMYLNGDRQDDALDNLRLIRRSSDRAPRRQAELKRVWLEEWDDEIKAMVVGGLPKGVTRWRLKRPNQEGTETRWTTRFAGWIRIGDNELLLGLYDAPWDAQKAIQAARDAAWHAVLSPNDHERVAVMAGLIRKRRSPTVLAAIGAELERLDPPPRSEAPEPDLAAPTPVGDALIHDGWQRRKESDDLDG
jgi:hypothetical protein